MKKRIVAIACLTLAAPLQAQDFATSFDATEVAPGIDVDKDILAQMAFAPSVADDLRLMDARIFREPPMGLAERFAK